MDESESDYGETHILQGRWLKEQHERFLQGMILHGKDWKIVEEIVKTRNGSQVRSHAQKFFIKLNKLARERRKSRNRDRIEVSEIEDQILKLFTEQDITANTPQEIISVIRKDWSGVSSLSQQRKTCQKNKKSQKQKNSELKQIEGILPLDFDAYISYQENGKFRSQSDKEGEYSELPEQSYFVKILKFNKTHFIQGNDFTNLIDFGHAKDVTIEEPIQEPRERGKSFALPDEQENNQKLKERLDTLHKAFGNKSITSS